MGLESDHEAICDKIVTKPAWKSGAYCVLGGILGNCAILGLALCSPIFIGAVVCKYTCTGIGAGAGWRYGIPGGLETLETMLLDGDIWNQITSRFKSEDPRIPFSAQELEEVFLDTRTDYARLYTITLAIFAERYERLPFSLESGLMMQEFRQMVRLLVKHHPMWELERVEDIQYSVERRLIRDLQPYLTSHYSSYNKNLENHPHPTELSTITRSSQNDPIQACIRSASMHFRHLRHEPHPKDKASILVSMIRGVATDLSVANITMSADDLLPIVISILVYNIDMLPGGDIALVYDYLRDNAGEDAYTATVLMSALHIISPCSKK